MKHTHTYIKTHTHTHTRRQDHTSVSCYSIQTGVSKITKFKMQTLPQMHLDSGRGLCIPPWIPTYPTHSHDTASLII